MIPNETISRIFNTKDCITQQNSEEFQGAFDVGIKRGGNKHLEVQAPYFSTPIFETDNMRIVLPNHDEVQLHGDAFWPANNATQDNQVKQLFLIC